MAEKEATTTDVSEKSTTEDKDTSNETSDKTSENIKENSESNNNNSKNDEKVESECKTEENDNGESLLLPLLKGLLLRNPQSNSNTNKSNANDKLSAPIEDSGTESGEDLKLLAAGLQESIDSGNNNNNNKNNSNDKENDLTNRSSSDILLEVTKALEKLQHSLLDGKELNLDMNKRNTLLTLVSRLQTGLLSDNDNNNQTIDDNDNGDNVENDKEPNQSIRRIPISNQNRFAKRRNRQSRHTIGVSREEIADARRLMEDIVLRKETPNENSPIELPEIKPKTYTLQKNNSMGTFLTKESTNDKTDNAIEENEKLDNTPQPRILYRPNQFVPKPAFLNKNYSVHTPPVIQMRDRKPKYKFFRQSLSLDQPRYDINNEDSDDQGNTKQNSQQHSTQHNVKSAHFDKNVSDHNVMSTDDEDDSSTPKNECNIKENKKYIKNQQNKETKINGPTILKNPVKPIVKNKTEEDEDDEEEEDDDDDDDNDLDYSSAFAHSMLDYSKGSSNKYQNLAYKKYKMKRANTIDFAKAKALLNSDSESEKENASRNLQPSNFGLKSVVQPTVEPVKKVVPKFKPKTENDHKFLAFLQKQQQTTNDKTSWNNPAKTMKSIKQATNWNNAFGNLKNVFESKDPALKPPPIGSLNSAKNFWKKESERIQRASGDNFDNVKRIPPYPWVGKEVPNNQGVHENLTNGYDHHEINNKSHHSQPTQPPQSNLVNNPAYIGPIQNNVVGTSHIQYQKPYVVENYNNITPPVSNSYNSHSSSVSPYSQNTSQSNYVYSPNHTQNHVKNFNYNHQVPPYHEVHENHHNSPMTNQINNFSHAPMSAFKPIPKKDDSLSFKPISHEINQNNQAQTYHYQPMPLQQSKPSLPFSDPYHSTEIKKPQLQPTKHIGNTGFYSQPSSPSKSPIGVPWAGKPQVERRVLNIAASKFENKQPDKNAVKTPNHSPFKVHKRRPSLPNSSFDYATEFGYDNTVNNTNYNENLYSKSVPSMFVPPPQPLKSKQIVQNSQEPERFQVPVSKLPPQSFVPQNNNQHIQNYNPPSKLPQSVLQNPLNNSNMMSTQNMSNNSKLGNYVPTKLPTSLIHQPSFPKQTLNIDAYPTPQNRNVPASKILPIHNAHLVASPDVNKQIKSPIDNYHVSSPQYHHVKSPVIPSPIEFTQNYYNDRNERFSKSPIPMNNVDQQKGMLKRNGSDDFPKYPYTTTDYSQPSHISTYAPANLDRSNSLTDTKNEPLVLTYNQPVYSPTCSNNSNVSVNNHSVKSPSDCTTEHSSVKSKIMKGPVQQTAVTVSSKTNRINSGKDDFDFKGNDAKQNLSSVLRQKVEDNKKVEQKLVNRKSINNPPIVIDSPVSPMIGEDHQSLPTSPFAVYNNVTKKSPTPVYSPVSVTSPISPVTPVTPAASVSPMSIQTQQTKIDAWNEVCQKSQNEHVIKQSPAFTNQQNHHPIPRAKSGHSLQVPKQYEAGIKKTEVTEKQKTVAAYFSGQKSPQNLSRDSSNQNVDEMVKSEMDRMRSSPVIVRKSSAINRRKTKDKNMSGGGGLVRSQTMPSIGGNIAMLDESNIEDAFEDLFQSSGFV